MNTENLTPTSPDQKYITGWLTLRDYFAAKAMQGFASVPEMTWNGGLYEMALQAYRWADAMMKARSNEHI